MPVILVPYLEGESQGDVADYDAYVPVRIAGDVRSDGTVLIYFPDNTGRVIAARHLLRLNGDRA